ncbi:sensor domain-containing diguanylate cyclase [Tepidibacillus marianensis]|uniref:sensor domain-containing diguanylate cyclase n=1 Tax=Tepidibacillus marianensis TaxID=3131995 RepID=UPI0030D0E7EB
MSSKKTIFTVIIFLLFTIGNLIWICNHYWLPLFPMDFPILLLYLLLALFIQSLPLKIGPIYVVMSLIVSIAVLLEFGFVAETLLTQIVILISMLISPERRSVMRIVFIHLMFAWMSISAGLAYEWVMNSITIVDPPLIQLVPVMVYAFVSFILNHLLLSFFHRILFGNKLPFLSEDMVWDAVSLLITIPLGILMFKISMDYDILGIFLLAFPILMVSHLLKIYVELDQSHHQLKSLNKISSSFTSELDLEKAIGALQQAIREMLVFDTSYIFLKSGIRLQLISLENYDGTRIEPEEYDRFYVKIGDGLSGKVALTKQAEIVGSDAELFALDAEPEYIRGNKSLLSVPILWNQQVVGVITLGSRDEYQFKKKDLTITLILASQAAVAIQNAYVYQSSKEQGKRDELTQVYNYRGFEEILNRKFNEAEDTGDDLSLLLIDIDHFKQVNDQYGHLAGNEVLQHLSLRLQGLCRKEDVIARYGGEEFTIILPHTNSLEALQIAERIRRSIEKDTILIRQSIANDEEIQIRVTASIGVSSFPEMSETIQDLIRHADRAMYIGSKQAGRNRVSLYAAG